MHSLRAVALRLFTLLILFTLGACGGGGGGGGGGDGGSQAGFSVSPESLSFNAASQSAPTPASKTITVTVTNGTVFLAAFFKGPAVATATFAITGPTTAVVTVVPAAPSVLGIGTHTGTITVLGCNDQACNSQVSGSPKEINVTYSIPGVFASVGTLSYTVGNAPLPADLTRQFSITGSPNQNWNIGGAPAWLSITPSSGNTASPVQVTAALIQAQLDTMSNGTYTGSITVVPASGLSLSVPVTLTIARTQVNYVAPYVATSNTSAEVVIRGENFSGVSIQDVKFGTSSAVSFNLVSDTEIRATHPTLSAGSYAVQLQDNLGTNRSFANLVVVDAPVYSASTLAYPTAAGKRVRGIIYDAERQALILSLDYSVSSSSADNEFVRYSFSSGAWSAPTRKAMFNLFSIALSTDGTQLLAADDKAIKQFDANTLNAGTSTSDSVNNPSMFNEHHMAVANDGTAVVAAGSSPNCGLLTRYRIRNPSFSSLASANTCSFRVAGSADGSRIVAGNDILTGVNLFNASTGSLTTPITLFLSATPALNRTGSRIVLNNTRVYDDALTFLGGLPSSSQAVALNADGTRAYSYAGGTTLRTYDLTAALVGGLYAEIGTGTTLPTNPGAEPRMTISPDGGTLFIAGGSAIVIVPTP